MSVIKTLRHINLFDDLDQENLMTIAPYFKQKHYAKGELVYISQAYATHFIFVLKGSIKIFRLSELGKEQIIRVIKPNEFTGELALFEGKRKAYAKTLDESELLLIEHDLFKKILREYPEVSLKMIEILSLRLHLSEEQTSLLSTNTAKERLLLYLEKEAIEKEGHKRVYTHQTKRFMASYLGMSSETLSRMLHQLEEEGKIKEVLNQYIELI